MLIDHYIESKDLKAHGVVRVLGLARPIQM